MNHMSIVIPAYNEEGLINIMCDTLYKVLNNKVKYDVIFVNDGSNDRTWEEINEASNKYTNVNGICFSKNFGKEAAVFAGLKYAKGDCIAVMDADLQHPPETLIKMYKLWQEGYEIIDGIKASRGKENILYKYCAKVFYKIISIATKVNMSTSSDFKLMDRKVVDIITGIEERHLFFRALSSWVGYKTTSVEFDVKEREIGKTKWTNKSLLNYAVKNITTFSTAPMQIVSFFGIAFFIFAIILGVHSLYKYFTGKALGGFTTVILLLLFIGSIIMISLGIIGYYIAKIYEETKKRPRYIVSKTIKDYEE